MPRIPVAQRRSDFIKAAVDVIATYGIDGATTRRIAEQAQANLAMLHYCYDSKEDLFADVYDYVAGKYCEVIKNSDPHGDVIDTAGRVLRGVMEFYIESPNFAAAALELVTWAGRQHGNRGIAVYDQALETVRATLRGARSEDPVEPAAIDEIAYVIAALADGFALSWYTYADRAAAAEQITLTTSVLESWLAARLGTAPVAS